MLRDAALMLDMLLAARDAVEFAHGLDAAGFRASRLHQAAVIRCLEVIGEAAGKVSAPSRDTHADLAWREMIGMRHRLIHGYAEVRVEVGWRVVTENLPGLVAALEKIGSAE